MKTSTLITNC